LDDVLDDVFHIKLTEVPCRFKEYSVVTELRLLEYKTYAIAARDASLHNKN
jgi:hypothetical protein